MGEDQTVLVNALDSEMPAREFWEQRGTRFRAVWSSNGWIRQLIQNVDLVVISIDNSGVNI